MKVFLIMILLKFKNVPPKKLASNDAQKRVPYSVFSPYWNLEISIQIRTPTLFPFGFEVLIQYTFTNYTLSFVFLCNTFLVISLRRLFPCACFFQWCRNAIYQEIARWLKMGEDKRCDMKRHIMCVPFHSQNVGRWKDIGLDNIEKQ